MVNDTTAPKRLLLNRPSGTEALPVQGSSAGIRPPSSLSSSAPTTSSVAPLRAASNVPPLTDRPKSRAIRAALRPSLVGGRELSASRVPVASPADHAEPLHRELKAPLREIITRRGPKDISLMFADLVSHGVSDVHMTRSGATGTFRIEARVDGHKQLVQVYEGSEAQTLSTLIKTGAKMTTGSNMVPEDGSYRLPIDGYDYRARAVSLPLFDGGEHIVFRLPQTGPLRPLEGLGFTESNLTALKALLDVPGGMTLFAGPMGEGKSTTSLSSLEYLRRDDDGVIITLEDPVERVVEGLKQIEVNEDVDGAGFADMMKYLVRSDANVLFIGEIRDVRTATAAVEIAKSGRRVIGTIHATDNISAFMRLIGLADETPLSVLDSVNGIISQRLVPRLVPGTSRFSGRYPIHEVTANSDELTDALVANLSRAHIRAAASATSTTFKENVDELVSGGITTLVEARKVVRNV